MDDSFKNHILNSSLTNHEKELLIYTGEKKIDKDQYFSVGEYFEAVRKCEELCSDIRDLHVSDKLYCYLFYHILVMKCEYDIKIYTELFKSTLFNDNFRSKLMELKNDSSGIITFMKTLAPHVDELLELIEEDKGYKAVKQYKKIIELCNRDVIPEGLTDEEIKKELDKRFFKTTFSNDLNNFKRRVKKPKFNPISEEYDKKKLVAAKTYAGEVFAFQKVLHAEMLEYHSKSKCIYNQMNDEFGIFHLGDVTLVTYKYDDAPDMVLKAYNLNLDWKTRDFWAKMFDPNIKFSDDPTVHYTIDGEDKKEMYMVVPRTFLKKPFRNLFGKKVIYAPEEYMDEALYLGLTENGKISLDFEHYQKFEELGFDYKYITDKLMSADHSFFFKDPSLIDELNVSNLDDFTHLGLIKTKTDPKSRNRCIAQIRAAAKKNPKRACGTEKKPNTPKSFRKERYLYPKPGDKDFKPRLPYKDD